jgi:hypothetical protein
LFQVPVDLAGAEFLQDHEQHILDEIARGGLVSQVPQAIEADAGRKPAAELRYTLIGVET